MSDIYYQIDGSIIRFVTREFLNSKSNLAKILVYRNINKELTKNGYFVLTT